MKCSHQNYHIVSSPQHHKDQSGIELMLPRKEADA